MLGRERILQLQATVSGAVRRQDVVLGEPFPRGESVIVSNGGLEKVHDLFVLLILGAVARHVEGGVASRVLAELMSPEISIGARLCDPVFVHPREEVISAEGFEEGANVGTVVGRHDGAVWERIGSVGSRDRVILAREIAVLRVGAVAEGISRVRREPSELTYQKSGQRPWSVKVFSGIGLSAQTFQNWVSKTKPPNVSTQQVSTSAGLAFAEQDRYAGSRTQVWLSVPRS
jgi:hypothetical protein